MKKVSNSEVIIKKALGSRMTRIKSCDNPKSANKASTGSVHTWG
ncbi:hypothetical protein SAMN05216167_12113 [Spirosoma endophyticum]|uniref:Uncharacterized protein n=1 Tax=Spirosoma endophyticum TaxID=662367 RepID=A0A1I2E3L0_9BACT|nr:hypothetical protein SAMN05216167_12113 [Spirosoma endophyticum]